MTDTITIPPEAVEAVAIELYYDAHGLSIAWQDAPAWTRDDFRRKATAAIRAALAAWPGMTTEPRMWRTAIILPITTENPDAET